MPILNVTTFSTHFSLVLDRNGQLITQFGCGIFIDELKKRAFDTCDIAN